MLCRNCGKRQATTHIKKVINGQAQEYHLCAQCAAQLGVANFNPFEMSDLFGSLFTNQLPQNIPAERCETCGSSFAEIAKRGKVGCPDCYKKFYNQLLPSLRKMHGKTKHAGKVPACAPEAAKASYRLNELKEQLQKAVSSEDYEQAAKLRDEIRQLEKEGNENA